MAPDLQVGQVRLHEFDGVEGEGGDAVSFSQPQLQEGPRQSVGPFVELAVGPAHVSAADGGFVGVLTGVANHRIAVCHFHGIRLLISGPVFGKDCEVTREIFVQGERSESFPLFFTKRGGNLQGEQMFFRGMGGPGQRIRAAGVYSIPAIFLARPFLASRSAWRRIMIRWAWGGPAPCMDSVR